VITSTLGDVTVHYPRGARALRRVRLVRVRSVFPGGRASPEWTKSPLSPYRCAHVGTERSPSADSIPTCFPSTRRKSSRAHGRAHKPGPELPLPCRAMCELEYAGQLVLDLPLTKLNKGESRDSGPNGGGLLVSRLARYLSLGSPWSSGLSCPENPRVGGSIPSQATIAMRDQ
jgi:hypothetical protein